MHQKYHQLLSVSEEKMKSMTELSRCYANYTPKICYKFSSALPNSGIGVQSSALLGSSPENTRQSNLKLFWSHSVTRRTLVYICFVPVICPRVHYKLLSSLTSPGQRHQAIGPSLSHVPSKTDKARELAR